MWRGGRASSSPLEIRFSDSRGDGQVGTMLLNKYRTSVSLQLQENSVKVAIPTYQINDIFCWAGLLTEYEHDFIREMS